MGDLTHAYAQPFSMGEGDCACLLIHGFTASPSQMRPMAEALAKAGYYVEGIRLPGHGTVISDMEKVTWRDWLSCVREAATTLRKRYKKVIAIGLSMGGVLSLLLGEEGLVDAVVSLAAPMRIFSSGSAFLSRFVWPFYRYAPWEALELQDFLYEYDASYPQTPVRRVKDLSHLMHKAERHLAKLTCPLLVVQSHEDKTVRPISADIIYARAGSADKQLLMLDHSPHVLTLGKERIQIFDRILLFLKTSC